MSRSAALDELEHPPISDQQTRRDIKFVSKKLGFTEVELMECLESPLKRHQDYPNNLHLFAAFRDIKSLLRARSFLRNK